MKSKAKNAPKKNKIAPISAQGYQTALSQMVHFSFKHVDSKATAGGIRLGGTPNHVLKGRISLQEIGADKIPLDYTSMATGTKPTSGELAKRSQQVTCNGEGYPPFNHSREEQDLRQALVSIYQAGLAMITPTTTPYYKLRQIYLPLVGAGGLPLMEEEHYLAVTPLHSGGLNFYMQKLEAQRISSAILHHPSLEPIRTKLPAALYTANPSTIKEWLIANAKEPPEQEIKSICSNEEARQRFGQHVSLAYGGAKPQNAGGTSYFMKRAYFFGAPSKNIILNINLARLLNGIALITGTQFKALMDNYQKGGVKTIAKHLDDSIKNLAVRSKKIALEILECVDEGLLTWKALPEEYEEARSYLRQKQENPEQNLGLTSAIFQKPGLKTNVMAALFCPEERNRLWQEKIAKTIAEEISSYRLHGNIRVFSMPDLEAIKVNILVSVKKHFPLTSGDN